MKASDSLEIESLDDVRRQKWPLNSQTRRYDRTKEIVLPIAVGNFELLVDWVRFATNDLGQNHCQAVAGIPAV